MYKTVRQGENSLQYTILPQTEEVLTNSGIKGKGRDYSPSSHARRISKKLMIYYMAIIFFGFLLAFGVLFFALVLCGIVSIDFPNHISAVKHEQLTVRTTTPSSTVQPDKSPTRKKELAYDIKITQEMTTHKSYETTLNSTTTKQGENSTTVPIETVLTGTPSTTVSHTSTTERGWIMPALKRLQISSTANPVPATDKIKTSTMKILEKLSSPYSHQRESNTDLMLGHDQLKWPEYEGDDDEDYDFTKSPTTSSTLKKSPTPTSRVVVQNQTNTTPIVVMKNSTTTDSAKVSNGKVIGTTVDPKEKNKSKTDSAKYMDMKEHILDDDDEEYKEPLTDEDDVSEQTTNDEVKMSQAKTPWLQTRWPFVDPSSYFQWTGYSARDNLLLPAILSAALSALLVLAIVCYALRRRQRCKRRIQEIGNLTSDLQAEDNAILLTAENPSEED